MQHCSLLDQAFALETPCNMCCFLQQASIHIKTTSTSSRDADYTSFTLPLLLPVGGLENRSYTFAP